jgi:GT2 family glycosyltransferase
MPGKQNTFPVCALTLNWNKPEETIACLHSLSQQSYPHLNLLVVDNGSNDDSVLRIQQAFPCIELVTNERNLGFAGGVNSGLRYALAQDFQFIFLINNDTVLDPACLSQLVEEAISSTDVGLVTAKIYYADEPERIWSVGGQFHPWTLEVVSKGDNELDVGQWETARDIDFAPLCGVLIRRELLDRVGPLDDRYFFYYEDMDFCRRVHLAGYRLRMAPSAKIWHRVSISSGGRNSPVERYWMAQSSGRYFRSYAQGWRLLVILPYRLGSAIKTTFRLLSRKQVRAAAAYWRGLIPGWLTGQSTASPPSWVAGGNY